MNIGYCKLEHEEQETIKLDVDEMIVDVCECADSDRPGLDKIISEMHTGDSITVSDISCIARNSKDLFKLIDLFESKGVRFVSIEEGIDTSTEYGQWLIKVLRKLTILDNKYLYRRRMEGIKEAKARGAFKGRVPLHVENFEKVYNDWKTGKISTAVEAMNILNLKPNTFYRRVRKYEAENNNKE